LPRGEETEIDAAGLIGRDLDGEAPKIDREG
jgi:hypothetical protein